jgi:hypothetical protein
MPEARRPNPHEERTHHVTRARQYLVPRPHVGLLIAAAADQHLAPGSRRDGQQRQSAMVRAREHDEVAAVGRAGVGESHPDQQREGAVPALPHPVHVPLHARRGLRELPCRRPRPRRRPRRPLLALRRLTAPSSQAQLRRAQGDLGALGAAVCDGTPAEQALHHRPQWRRNQQRPDLVRAARTGAKRELGGPILRVLRDHAAPT